MSVYLYLNKLCLCPSKIEEWNGISFGKEGFTNMVFRTYSWNGLVLFTKMMFPFKKKKTSGMIYYSVYSALLWVFLEPTWTYHNNEGITQRSTPVFFYWIWKWGLQGKKRKYPPHKSTSDGSPPAAAMWLHNTGTGSILLFAFY